MKTFAVNPAGLPTTVFEWRVEQLTRANISLPTANLLASTAEDLHEIAATFRAGCSEAHLVAIFGPDLIDRTSLKTPDLLKQTRRRINPFEAP